MNPKTLISSFLVSMLIGTQAYAQDKGIIEAALGSMMFGDQGWNASTVEVFPSDPFENCKVDFRALIGYETARGWRIGLDLNRAYWKSIPKIVDGKWMFSVTGEAGFARIISYANPSNLSVFEFEIPVSLESFMNAF